LHEELLRRIWLDVLRQSEKLVPSQLTVTQDLDEKSGSDCLACMNGHHSDATIRMTEAMMTAPHSYIFEASSDECLDELLAR